MSSPSSKLPNLNTQTEEFIEKIEEKATCPLYKMKAEDARLFLNEVQNEYYKKINTDITDTKIFGLTSGSIELKCIRPCNNKEKLPAIVYAHGGGWLLGDEKDFDMLLKRLAIETNSAVIFPIYSRTPDFKYPKAIHEIYSTLQYVYENPDEFNIDNTKLIVAGDSAGGNMAAVTALKTKFENGPKIKAQLLFYPVTNADMDTDSYDAFRDGPWLTKKAMEWFWQNYLSDKKEREDIFVSPLKASEEELKNLPPTLIITAENDVLRDEGEAFARKLDSAGVSVVNIRMNGTIHDFMMLNALSETPQAKMAFAITGAFVKKLVNQ